MQLTQINHLFKMKLNELNLPVVDSGKAGVIPYIRDGDTVKMLFMVPSDPAYGGDRPAIAKGHVDKGETPEAAAIREAEEELGLKRSNMKGAPTLAWSGELSGLEAHYILHVFIVEVNDEDDFNEPHFETGSTHWLTASEFASKGRRSQNSIVQQVVRSI
jgi:8-oxo-dGTP pyrophosphatase MutT (NUDIX family)